jgi:hypothetical protein
MVVVDKAYLKAAYLSKLQKTGVMFMTDIDGTMTSGKKDQTKEQFQKELDDRKSVRSFLDEKGVVLGAVTARTCSLTLSSDAFDASPTLKTAEYPTRWGIDPATQKRTRIPLEEVDYFVGCLNFDFTGSFGGPTIVKNGSGYLLDQTYYDNLTYDYIKKVPGGDVVREPWRHVVNEFLYDYLGAFKENMSKLERLTNYDNGLTDSAPLAFRYQFDFYGRKGFEAIQEMRNIIEEQRAGGNTLAIRINVVDESKPHPTDPEKSRYTLYLIPWNAAKENMVNRIFSQSVAAAECSVQDTKLFYAGDTMTDLRSGLYAGGDAKMTFLLATGSLLAPYIIERKERFGVEDLSWLWAKPVKGRHKHRLISTSEKGVYKYVVGIRGERVNTIVIGDERYGSATAPGSLRLFAEEFVHVK